MKFEYGLVPREAGYYTAKPAMARYRPDADQGATQVEHTMYPYWRQEYFCH